MLLKILIFFCFKLIFLILSRGQGLINVILDEVCVTEQKNKKSWMLGD